MWFLWKMSNYPTAWHENMKYLKLLMSDKLSTVEVSVQQPPSVCNVGGIIKWESIKFCFPDKSSTPKEAENHLLRLGLHLMPVHTAARGFHCNHQGYKWVQWRYYEAFWIKASNPWLTFIFMLCHSGALSGADVAGRPGGASTSPSDKNKINGSNAKVD